MDSEALIGREPWLPAFFGGGNQLTWEVILQPGGPWHATLRPWLEAAVAGHADAGLVLPAQAEDGSVIWYACALQRQERAALAEQIESFLGPARIEFDRTQVMAPGTEVERALAERFAGGVLTFRMHQGADKQAVMRSLETLGGLLRRRPPRRCQSVRSFAEVRTDFERALLTGDEARARRCIDELRATGRLSAVNERFLHVRLLVALGREALLVNDAAVMSWLAEADPPIRVLRDVIEALYTVHFAPLEQQPIDAAHWVDTYRARVQRHGRLLRARRGLRAPSVLRAFLLHEIARPADEIRWAEAEAVHALLATQPEQRQWADAMLEWGLAARDSAPQPPVSVAPLAGGESAVAPVLAPAARAASEQASAYQLASIQDWAAAPPSARALAGLLQAAVVDGTLEGAAEALKVLSSYPEVFLSDLSPIQRGMLDLLHRLVPAEEDAVVPADWTAWAHWWVSAAGTEDNAERAQAIAEQGAEQWDQAAWIADAGRRRSFADLLQSHPQRFRPYLATIHASLQDVQASPAAQAEIVVQLTTVVALDSPMPADLPLLNDWVATLVRLGAGRDACDEMAGALRAAWGEVRSLVCLDWACDVVEMLAAAPRTSGGELDVLFSDVLGFATGHQHRLTAAQRRVLSLLALDFGLDFTPGALVADGSTGAAKGEEADYTGVSIGIYTLQESVVSHLRTAVQQEFPGASVSFNHDHVATPALAHMARDCSVMVFAWRCSKHQAFYCIQKERPIGLPLLRPQGRGSASIMRELTEHLRGAGATR